MRKGLKQKPSNKQRLRIRFVVVSGLALVALTLSIGWLVFLNISMNTKIKASMTSGGGALLNNGEIISEFTWDKDPATKATLGPDAIKISKGAHTLLGGRASTSGLAPGNPARDINMEIASSPLFDAEGIDVSIDFKRHEPTGSFYSRGRSFDFGFKKGFIMIVYSLIGEKGKSMLISEVTSYEIPQDEMFRNFRFIYTPTTGKAEIFVNSVIVWSHQGEKNTAMYWDKENIMIGKGIDGGGIDQPVLDNLVVRTTGSTSALGESVMSFMLESSANGVQVHWSTSMNEKVDYFTIERSVNGIDFVNLANVKPKNESGEDVQYVYEDVSGSNSGIIFYRLRQTLKDGRFFTNAVSAIKLKINKDLTIDRVSPDPFGKTFNLSYYVPIPGKVWVQLVDENGKVKCSESFEAQPGKNIYLFKDNNNLATGEYTLNLVQNNKKVTTKVTKI